MYLSLVPDPAPFLEGVGGIVPTTHFHLWERAAREERWGEWAGQWELKTDSHHSPPLHVGSHSGNSENPGG